MAIFPPRVAYRFSHFPALMSALGKTGKDAYTCERVRVYTYRYFF